MQRMRLQICVAVAASVLMATALWADDGSPEREVLEPLAVLADSIDAIHTKDFARYVEHLAPEERAVQAGYVMFVAQLTSPSIQVGSDAVDPKALLLMRALEDLIDQHVIPEKERNEEQQAAQAVSQQITSQMFFGAMMQTGYGPPHYPTPTNLIGARDACVQSTGVLKDPKAFLVAVLESISSPTQVSSKTAGESTMPSEFSELIESYEELKWTLYTRGDYAVAVFSDPVTVEQQPVTSDAFTAGPQPPPDNLKEPQVEFRRIDGCWKIVRLLPIAGRMPRPTVVQPAHYPSTTYPPAAGPLAPYPSPVPSPTPYPPTVASPR